MDLPIILSITAILVSIFTSVITLWLTELQGPDIDLISSPKFEVDYHRMNLKRKEQLRRDSFIGFVPTVLELKPAEFVFANHGGKSGTVLSIDFVFLPSKDFKSYFRVFDSKLSLLPEEPDSPTLKMPMTIERNGNKVFFAFTYIHTLDWKRMALAEVLNPAMNVDGIIERAVEKSKENFRSFCNFLNESNTLGTISCDLNLTKGRFRTRVKTKRLFSGIPVGSQTDLTTFLRGLLQTWEDIEPTHSNLFYGIVRPLESLIDEVKENIRILGSQITNQNVYGPIDLKTDKWRSLCVKIDSYLETTQWFLIRSESGLETELKELYQNIDRYIKLINDTHTRRNFTTDNNFETALGTINERRKELMSNAQAVESRLSQLHNQRIR